MSLSPMLFDESNLLNSKNLDINLLHDSLYKSVESSPSITQLQDYFKNLHAAIKEHESSVKYDKNEFQANFDVQHFEPEEICVKGSGDNEIIIEGKHEEKNDEHGQIYRHFVRKFTLPKNYDINKLEPMLSSDGVLSITAPRGCENGETRVIPIIETGQPTKSIKNNPPKLRRKNKFNLR